MLRHETLLLSPTQITADEFSMIENFFEKLMVDSQGKVTVFDKWGKYRLSYPIKRNDFGMYFLVRYEMPETQATNVSQKIAEFLKIKCNEIVLRYVTVKLKPNAPSIYKRPDPVDSGKVGDLDSFIKENKMETFLNSKVEGSIDSKENVDKDLSEN
jgi:ribosomal protein S6